MAANVIRLTLLLSLSSLWFFATATESYACSCSDPGSPSEEFERSAAVFAGKVVSEVVSVSDPDGPDVLDSENHLTTGSEGDIVKIGFTSTIGFEVDTVWKGPTYETMYLTISSPCGFNFVEGEKYIVYSHDGSSTSLCSRTRLLSAAQEDLDVLGDGSAPQPGTSAPTPEQEDLDVLGDGSAPQPGTSAPTPEAQSSGGGCNLLSRPGGGTSDASWLGMMIAMGVWFGARRRPGR